MIHKRDVKKQQYKNHKIDYVKIYGSSNTTLWILVSTLLIIKSSVTADSDSAEKYFPEQNNGEKYITIDF